MDACRGQDRLGKITVCLKPIDGLDAGATTDGQLVPLELCVRDNGCGMLKDPEEVHRSRLLPRAPRGYLHAAGSSAI